MCFCNDDEKRKKNCLIKCFIWWVAQTWNDIFWFVFGQNTCSSKAISADILSISLPVVLVQHTDKNLSVFIIIRKYTTRKNGGINTYRRHSFAGRRIQQRPKTCTELRTGKQVFKMQRCTVMLEAPDAISRAMLFLGRELCCSVTTRVKQASVSCVHH